MKVLYLTLRAILCFFLGLVLIPIVGLGMWVAFIYGCGRLACLLAWEAIARE